MSTSNRLPEQGDKVYLLNNDHKPSEYFTTVGCLLFANLPNSDSHLIEDEFGIRYQIQPHPTHPGCWLERCLVSHCPPKTQDLALYIDGERRTPS